MLHVHQLTPQKSAVPCQRACRLLNGKLPAPGNSVLVDWDLPNPQHKDCTEFRQQEGNLHAKQPSMEMALTAEF